jgi:hypothetical protein
MIQAKHVSDREQTEDPDNLESENLMETDQLEYLSVRGRIISECITERERERERERENMGVWA